MKRKLNATVMTSWLLLCLVLNLANFPLAQAEAVDVDAAEAKARGEFMDHFAKFTEDKNIVGKPLKADGTRAPGQKKTKFDQDDGLPYQSDLTYHDLAFNTTETEKANSNDKNQNEKTSKLFAFVSPHGGISAAGGSSQLERAAYSLSKKFTKQEEENKGKKEDEQTGTKYKSVFKITTQEVIDDGKGNLQQDAGNNPNAAKQAGNAKGDNKKETDKVERFELREEARPDIEKVGEDSFETVRKSARDKGNENDETTLANGVLLRYAAGEATQAMWNSTLANLIQRRVNRGVQAKNFPSTPQLSEGVPNCAAWSQAALGEVAKIKDPKDRKALQDEAKRMTDQCQQLAAVPYNEINPRFEAGKDGKEELKTGDLKKEDGFIRDSRVQLETLKSAGKEATSVPSNWKYSGADLKAKVTIDFDDEAKAQAPKDMSVKEQLESYNNQLREAAKGYDEVKTRLPDLKVNSEDVLKYQIQPETKSVMEINQSANAILREDGVKVGSTKTAQDYGTLTGQSQK